MVSDKERLEDTVKKQVNTGAAAAAALKQLQKATEQAPADELCKKEHCLSRFLRCMQQTAAVVDPIKYVQLAALAGMLPLPASPLSTVGCDLVLLCAATVAA